MTRTNRLYVRMVSLCAALFCVLSAAAAYILFFDWMSTLIFLAIAVPNLYFYYVGIVKEWRIYNIWSGAQLRQYC